jgi:EKC/KEOPS complex subunit PCC1/LAGE3
VRIPFETERQALIAKQTIEPDPELRSQDLQKTLNVDGTQLVASFAASTDRNLRVAVNAFMDNINLVAECLDELDIDKL